MKLGVALLQRRGGFTIVSATAMVVLVLFVGANIYLPGLVRASKVRTDTVPPCTPSPCVIGRIALGGGAHPYADAYDPSNKELYTVASYSNFVAVINTTSLKVIKNITVGTEPFGAAYSPSNGKVYVSNFNDNTVSVIDPSTNTVVKTISVSSGPYGVLYSPSNHYVYVAEWYSGTVTAINTATNTVVTDVPAGSGAVGLAYDYSNQYIYVANYYGNTTTVVNTMTDTDVGSPIHVGGGPSGVAYDNSTGYVYITNYYNNTSGASTSSGSVSIISPSTETVIKTVVLSGHLWGVAADPGQIFVASYDTGFMYIWDGDFYSLLMHFDLGSDGPSHVDIIDSFAISGGVGYVLAITNAGSDDEELVYVAIPTSETSTTSSTSTSTTTTTSTSTSTASSQETSSTTSGSNSASSSGMTSTATSCTTCTITTTATFPPTTTTTTAYSTSTRTTYTFTFSPETITTTFTYTFSPSTSVTSTTTSSATSTSSSSSSTTKSASSSVSSSAPSTTASSSSKSYSSVYTSPTRTQTSTSSTKTKTLTTTGVICTPDTTAVNAITTCNAVVTGQNGPPPGSVGWAQKSSNGGHVSFTPSLAVCTLTQVGPSSSACSVKVKGVNPGLVSIEAGYSGDSQNLPSAGASNLNVNSTNVVTKQSSSTSTISGGGASLDQSGSTGVKVTISGSTAADGSSVTLTSQKLSAPSEGEPAVALSGGLYYDINITGITDGTAQVCITDASVSAGTTMRYWNGSAWVNPSGTTVSGNTICSNIPVADLVGTNVGIGTVSAASADYTLEYAGGIAAAVIVAGILFLRRRKPGVKKSAEESSK